MRKYIKKKISLIIPTYNEENNIINLITEIIKELKNYNYEIIIVDDGSIDNTVENIFQKFENNKNIVVIQREIDRGLIQSIKFALQSISGEIFVVMDGDGQHSPKNIKPLIKELDKFDLSIGSRELKNMTSMSKTRVFLSRFFNLVVRTIISTKLSDPLTGFFAGKAALLNKKFFLLKSDGFKVLLDLIYSNKSQKIKITERKINFYSRKSGESKLGPQVMFSFMTQIISFIFRGFISAKLIGFLIIGGLGSFLHIGIFIFLFNLINVSFIYSHIFATLITSSVNFLMNNYLNFYSSKINSFKNILISIVKYYLINIPGILASIFGAGYMYNVLLKNEIMSSMIGILFETMFKYFMSKTWIWKSN